MRFEEGNFDDPRVIALLDAHVSRARAETGRAAPTPWTPAHSKPQTFVSGPFGAARRCWAWVR